jgi:hypothetical protein
MFASQYGGNARSSTAFASFVSSIQVCRIMREEYKTSRNARKRQQQSTQVKAVWV